MSEAIEQKWWERLEGGRRGVYRLVALSNATSLTPAPLNRVCGTDETGTLYIGGSDKPLKDRLGALVTTIRADYKGEPHRPLSKPLSARFPANLLAMSWEYNDDPWWREARLLMAYEQEFGERPPNNGQRSVIDRPSLTLG